MPPAQKKPALVIPQRPVDAEPTPPPPGYTPGAQLTQTPQGVLNPAVAEAQRLAARDAANTPADDEVLADDSARNAQNETRDPLLDVIDEGSGSDEPPAYTYASEHQVQAARLVVRAYARQRDGVALKADAARAAIAELQQMGGNRAQVAMVLTDARVRPRELGLKADGSPAS